MFVMPGILVVAFPIYVYLAGWLVASLHTLLVATWAVLLTNLVLVRFRKLPFTAHFQFSNKHSIRDPACRFGFGFLIYALSTPEFESSALLQPWRMVTLLSPSQLSCGGSPSTGEEHAGDRPKN